MSIELTPWTGHARVFFRSMNSQLCYYELYNDCMDELITRRCARCGETKSIDEFHKDRSRPSGVYSYCKPCNTANHREWAQKNKKHLVNYHRNDTRAKRAWYQRIRAKSIDIYGGVCVACGSTEQLELDHVNEDGGEHRKREAALTMYARIAREGHRLTDVALQLLCKRCHTAKSKEAKALSKATKQQVSLAA